MTMTISPVRGRDDLEDFLLVPYLIYADDPNYVFPLLSEQRQFLDRDRNPFFNHAEAELWVARRHGQAVGRVASCVDRYHNENHGEQTGFFGFYEAIEDSEVSRGLLDAASAWLREKGQDTMRGPSCFTTNHDFLGLQVDGEFSQPVVGMPYTPPYYQQQLEDYGLTKAMDLWAWRLETDARVPPKIQAMIDTLLASNTFSVRTFRMDRFDEDAEIVRSLYNRAWHRNWGFIPMDEEEFAHAAKDMKKMVDPDFLLIAEANGQPVGFCLTLPDFNQALKPCRGKLFPFGWLKFLLRKRQIDYARTPLMGVVPEFRQKGVDVAMVYKTMQGGFARGITRGECSWILEDNKPMNLILQGYGADRYKTYRIYDLSFSP